MNPALQHPTRAVRATLRISKAGVALAIALSTACAPKADQVVDSASAIPLPAPAQPGEATAAGDTTAGRITEYGLGVLRAGMTFAAANDSLKGALKTGAGANLGECDYVKWEGGPPGLRIMVVENKIARVETSDASIATAAGARVGDSEERINALYPGRVVVSPHKYTDGHYLTVKSSNAADSLYQIIFETDKNKVTTLRGGMLPAVAFIEGCS